MKPLSRALALLLCASALGACAGPQFVRDSAVTEDQAQFLVSDRSRQYIVQCDRRADDGELENCRHLSINFRTR